MTGLSGRIKFDQHGLRTDFELEIVELKKDGLVKVGAWTEKAILLYRIMLKYVFITYVALQIGVNFTRNYTESYTEIVESLANKTLVVTTIRVSCQHFCFHSKISIRMGGDKWYDFAKQSPPYTMFRKSSKRLEGNDVFEGYAPDLIKEIADILSKGAFEL